MRTMAPSGRPQQRKIRRSIELDGVDRRILELLASDARIPNATMAAKVGIAPSTCLARVRRLEDSEVITAYRADLAPDLLGKPLQALVFVRLQVHARGRIGKFAQRLAVLPGVLNVFFLAGVNDFLVHVATRSPDELRNFVVENLSASRDVATTETNLIFEHVSSGSTPLLTAASEPGPSSP